MKKTIQLLALILFVFIFSTLSVNAGDFNGILSFRKIDGQDTVRYKYYVKGDKIRVESFDEHNELNGIMLINMANSKVLVLSSYNKLYSNVPVSSKKPADVDLDLIKSKNKKSVAGKNCNQWTVTDKLSGEKFEYWVHKGSYSFFNKMLRVLNRKELLSVVWIKMEVKDDYFPMLGIEYSPSGEVITKIESLEIKEKDLPDELFILPADYEILERQH